MSVKCPNIKHPDWISIREKYGKDIALLLYNMNGEEIPTMSEAKELLKQIKYSNRNVNKALKTGSPDVAKFVLDKLKALYPEVKFFNDITSFSKYVEQYGGDTSKIGINTIGHAFMDSVFIDETSAVQEIGFHEMSHIYWGALPDSNKVKKAIKELFAKQYSFDSAIEEAAVRNITNAGISIASIELNGSTLEKFINLLQNFWAEVKNFLGVANGQDLTRIIANDIWNNRHNFNKNSFTNGLVKNMAKENDGVHYDPENHTYHLGNIQFFSPTGILSLLKSFNPVEVARTSFYAYIQQQELSGTTEKLDQSLQAQQEYIDKTLKQWKLQNEIGTTTHAIAQGVVNNKSIEEIKDTYVNEKEGKRIRDYVDDEMLQAIHGKIQRFIQKKIDQGWTVRSEVLLASLKYQIAGTADIILEKENEAVILDFKSHFREDTSSQFYGQYFKAPFGHIPNTKENAYRLQLNMYANSYEEQEGKDVIETTIIPLLYDLEDGKISAFQIENNNLQSWKRLKRTKSGTDKYREEAYELMDYAHKISLGRQAEDGDKKSINQLAKEKGISVSVLKKELLAIKTLRSILGHSTKEATPEEVQDMLSTGINHVSKFLINALGFEEKDLFGENAMPLTEMLEIWKGKKSKYKKAPDGTIVPNYEKRSDAERRSVYKTKPEQADFNKFLKITNKIKSINDFNQYTLEELTSLYIRIDTIDIDEAETLRIFLQDVIMSKWIAKKLALEMRDDFAYSKQWHLMLYDLVGAEKPVMYGFSSQVETIAKLFRNKMNISTKQSLLQIISMEMLQAHTATVMESMSLRSTLQSIVDDKYDADGNIKPKKERVPLSDEDFAKVVFTKDGTDIEYLLSPSIARNVLEKEYGKDDSRPARIAAYVTEVERIVAKYDHNERYKLHYRNGNVMIPQIEMNWEEILRNLSIKNIHHTVSIKKYFGISKYDNVLRRYGSKYGDDALTFNEVKKRLFNEWIELDAQGKSIGHIIDQIKEARDLAKREYVEGPLQKKTIKLLGKQSGRIVMPSKNLNASFQEHLSSFIESKFNQQILPLAKFAREKYRESQKEHKDTPEGQNQTALDWLEIEIDKNIYNAFREGISTTIIKGSDMTVSYLAKLYLGMNIGANINNRLIGLVWNWVRHPITMTRSYRVAFETGNFLLGKAGYKKIKGILVNNNIESIMQDAKFSKYAGIMDTIEAWMFKPLDVAETFNQGELLRGMLTTKELAAYNVNGKAKIIYHGITYDPDENTAGKSEEYKKEFEAAMKHGTVHPDAFSPNRLQEIKMVLAQTNGYYGWNKSPYAYYAMGRLSGMLYFSWYQSIFKFFYSEKNTDTLNREHKGIINTLAHVGKVLHYNFLNLTSSGKRKTKQLELLKEKYYRNSVFKERANAVKALYEFNKYLDPNDPDIIKEVDYEGETQYLVAGLDVRLSDFEELLLEEALNGSENSKGISLKDLALVDKQNFTKLINLIIIRSILELSAYLLRDDYLDLLYGEDDEETGERGSKRRYLTRRERVQAYFYSSLIRRLSLLSSDTMAPIDISAWGDKLSKPIVPLRAVMDLYGFTKSMFYDIPLNTQDAKFQESDEKHYAGELKAVDQSLNLFTGYLRSPIKDLIKINRTIGDKPYFENLAIQAENYADSRISDNRQKIWLKAKISIDKTKEDESLSRSEKRDKIKTIREDRKEQLDKLEKTREVNKKKFMIDYQRNVLEKRTIQDNEEMYDMEHYMNIVNNYYKSKKKRNIKRDKKDVSSAKENQKKIDDLYEDITNKKE